MRTLQPVAMEVNGAVFLRSSEEPDSEPEPPEGFEELPAVEFAEVANESLTSARKRAREATVAFIVVFVLCEFVRASASAMKNVCACAFIL